LVLSTVTQGNATDPIKNITIENLKVYENEDMIWHGKWPSTPNDNPFMDGSSAGVRQEPTRILHQVEKAKVSR
jgi:hypothetical protein